MKKKRRASATRSKTSQPLRFAGQNKDKLRPAQRKQPLVPPTIGRPEMLVNGSDQVFRRLIHAIFAFSALHEAIRDSYAAHVDLGGVQYTVLQSIRHLGAEQQVGISDIAEHLRLSGSFITVETNKLQALGLVEKKQASTDKRRVSLRATKKAAILLNQLAPMQRTVNDVQFANLSEKQFRDFLALLEQLTESSQAALTLLHYLKGSEKARPLPSPSRLAQAIKVPRA